MDQDDLQILLGVFNNMHKFVVVSHIAKLQYKTNILKHFLMQQFLRASLVICLAFKPPSTIHPI